MRRYWWAIVIAGFALVSAVRLFTGTEDISSTATLQAAIVATCPILMAALGGLWSERAGVVNIGLEGQMILGTWGAAYSTYHWGPWIGVLGAAVFALIGGALHGLATITFGVDHIVSGVAVNLVGAGTATFLAEAIFPNLNGGGPRQLVGLDGPATITVPGLSDAAVHLADKHWFLLSDVAAVVAALTTGISSLAFVIFALVAVSGWILWRTPFGLRLRSCGENPQAAETLGINVIRYKWIATLVSSGLAGVGGAFLALVAASGFTTGQTGGRGYIGLAAMIFGNWRPGGLLTGALMFGYTDALRLRDPHAVHALLLLLAVGLLVMTVLQFRQRRWAGVIAFAVTALVVAGWFAATKSVPSDLTSMTPYLTTMFVLALGQQRLRMPAADGQIYRKGSAG